MLRLVTVICAGALMCACAFGDTPIEIVYDETTARDGVIAETESLAFYISEVTDGRSADDIDAVGVNKDEELAPVLVGYKRNGYGQKTGNVIAAQPITDLVEAAFETAIVANGHSVSTTAEGADAGLAIDVKKFWFDAKTGFWTVEFFGDVQFGLALSDLGTGETVFEGEFSGYHSERSGGGLSGTWGRIMSTAFEDAMREITLSLDLAEALEDIAANDASMMDVDAGGDGEAGEALGIVTGNTR